MGRFFLLLGPSGVGKTTIVRRLLQEVPQLHFPISCTTRPARPGERQGVDYIFMSEEEFKGRLLERFFLEWDRPHGAHLYGIPRQPALQLLESGLSVVREIGYRGLRQLRSGAAREYVTSIFLQPESADDLRQRLAGRGEAQVNLRLETADEEIAAAAESDHVVTVRHGEPEAAYEAVAIIVRTALSEIGIKPT